MTAKIIIEIDLLAGPYEVSQQLLKLKDNIQRVNKLLYGRDPMGAADVHGVNPFGRPPCEIHGIKEDLECGRCREILGLEALKSSTGRKRSGREVQPLEPIRCSLCGDQGHSTAQHVDEAKARPQCEHCGSEEHASHEHPFGNDGDPF